MQNTSTPFQIRSKQAIRRPSFQVLIDWDLDGVFDDESNNVLSLEGERHINEPLFGIHQAQMDVTLSNVSKRYSSTGDSPIASLIRINRKMQMKLGFHGENIPFGRGISEIPIIDEEKQEVRIHFWDELENLQNFKLSDGSELYLDIRSDLYIWEVLDAVYEDYFTVLASFDSDETIVGGTAETTNMRGGDSAIKLEATSGGTDSAYRTVSLDLSGYSDDDYITLFTYVEDITKVDSLLLRLHKVVDDTYADLELTDYDLQDGWNELQIPREDFIGVDQVNPPSTWFTIGTSQIEGSAVIPSGVFDWDSIVRVEVILDAKPSQDVYIVVDEIRIVDAVNYPQRIFDMGLQTIPVATFSGNTALFEIKSAAESEGGLFFADEEGRLNFWNRQHYNNNPEFKLVSHQLTFSRMTAFENPKGDQGVINFVKVKINPRKIVTEKEIWRYGETPQIGNGDTLTIWASFIDPVPTTVSGLVTPVENTDYEANDNADGSGTDRSTNISIAITKFTNSAKLEITNGHSSPVYLTLMKLRGTPAEPQGETIIKIRDETSIATYGELEESIETKYLASSEYAQLLGQQIIDWYKDPIDRVKSEYPALPQSQIGDMISVLNERTNSEKLMRLIGYSFVMRNGSMFKQTARLRAVDPFELLNFFEIGASAIEGSDVIAA